jgi:Fe-S-cluster containining protein
MADNLERIYRAVPSTNCKGLCTDYCGPIEMSATERDRIAARGVVIPPGVELINTVVENDLGIAGLACPALVDGRCSVYEDRPLICRLWGVVESMPCPYGCEPEGGLMMDSGAQILVNRTLALDADWGLGG